MQVWGIHSEGSRSGLLSDDVTGGGWVGQDAWSLSSVLESASAAGPEFGQLLGASVR